MAKTYRITIEYTTTEDMSSAPDYWDWSELLDLDIATETFGVWVDKVETNEDHVRYINEQNEFADA
jgi:hypothetical protein